MLAWRQLKVNIEEEINKFSHARQIIYYFFFDLSVIYPTSYTVL